MSDVFFMLAPSILLLAATAMLHQPCNVHCCPVAMSLGADRALRGLVVVQQSSVDQMVAIRVTLLAS